MPNSEGVIEVQDGDDEAQELSQGHHQSYCERSTLRCQEEHTSDADVLCYDIHQKVYPHHWYSLSNCRDLNRNAFIEEQTVVVDVCGQEQEPRQRKAMIVEKSLL